MPKKDADVVLALLNTPVLGPLTETSSDATVRARVPRTLRLRASTAAALRAAWLEAKHDDVLLSHQDFASDLLDVALDRRRLPSS